MASLPADIARCRGNGYAKGVPHTVAEHCVDCARRLEGIRDYVSGNRVMWMEPLEAVPCPERLVNKHA